MEESLFSPDNSEGTLGGQRYNCMCNMQQERGSHLHNYPINVHCESQPLQALDALQYILMSHTSADSQLRRTLTDCDGPANTFTQISFRVDLPPHSHHSHSPCSIREQSLFCLSKRGYVRISEKSIEITH